MKIGLRGGHSCYCIGAIGILNEYYECQKLYKRVAELLISAGHIVIDCNTSERDMRQDCFVGENKANANNVDLFVTIHMNAGGGKGTEVWCYNASSSQAIAIGKRVCNNMNKLGYVNRGIKYSTAFFDLYRTNAEAMIIETLFVDSHEDTSSKYDVEKISRAIANAIDGNILLEPEKKVIEPKYKVRNLIIYNSDADKAIAHTFAMILNYYKEDAHILSYDEYMSNEDWYGYSVFAVGGSLVGKIHYDKIFLGKDRNETAFKMFEHLKEKGY